ncbi:hypothetical protein BKA65DRAFT_141647 [Rhexocercosporidium sp. MPI-PUGE-AT-0058]|nr:hypothetical protein BKA65DRAFT_141647 [Rhexocercosporidium sp. MPI-PUGE-AT-0058]
MDPMDYTMDEAGNHGNPGNNTATRYPCQQSSPPAPNGFSSQGRDGHHFDPVHDASNYYYGLNANAPARSSYTGPQHQHMQHWGGSPYMPGPGWQGFGDMMRPNPSRGGPDAAASSYRGSARNYPDMPWGSSRAFGRLEDTYGPFSNQLSGHNLPSDNSMGTGGGGTGGSASQPSALRPSPFAPSFDHQPMDLPGQSGPSHNRVPSLGAGRTNRHQIPPHSFPEPPNLRYQRGPRPSLSRPGMHGGTPAERISWGDSDEESISDLENEAVRREATSYRESEEQHALIMQGALAAGRRMMAKEAFTSLEKMKVEDLPNESKDCTICYNDFGVENPDGIVEQPVRWPKCKHLFGDKCIKRWFDEGKDTCPYCREKIPSEMAAKGMGMETQMRMLQRRRMMHAAATGQQQARHGVPPNVGFFPDDTASGRLVSTIPVLQFHPVWQLLKSAPSSYEIGCDPLLVYTRSHRLWFSFFSLSVLVADSYLLL